MQRSDHVVLFLFFFSSSYFHSFICWLLLLLVVVWALYVTYVYDWNYLFYAHTRHPCVFLSSTTKSLFRFYCDNYMSIKKIYVLIKWTPCRKERSKNNKKKNTVNHTTIHKPQEQRDKKATNNKMGAVLSWFIPNAYSVIYCSFVRWPPCILYTSSAVIRICMRFVCD